MNTNVHIKGRKGTGTEYVVALIPLGGYVKMAGALDESMDTVVTNAPDEFTSKTVPQKLWILSAGVLMNTAIAKAGNPILMASAMKKAVDSGREAFLAGRMEKNPYASASSPEEGSIE